MDQTPPPAWEPLTPHGVAGFARASLGRLLLTQLLVAALAAGVVVWFLVQAWFPVVGPAIAQLPEQGEISGQQLDWRGDSPVKLAGNHFLGFSVDLNHSGQLAREAQLQLEFGRKNLRIFYSLDYTVVDYPAGWSIAFNRTDLLPKWGAWKPALVAGAAVGTVLGLMLAWALLATLYCLPVRWITLFENRDLTWRQSWRLAGAALMPGALFLTAGIVWHILGWMDLVRLGGVAGMHFVIGWIYLFVSPFFLPRHPSAPVVRTNPFASEDAANRKKKD
jgi:hypothetical protein